MKNYALVVLSTFLFFFNGAANKLNISSVVKEYCSHCNNGNQLKDKTDFIHQLHSDLKTLSPSLLQLKLNEAFVSNKALKNDTVNYLAHLALVYTFDALKLRKEAIQSIELIRSKWPKLSKEIDVYLQTEVGNNYLELQFYDQALKYYKGLLKDSSFKKSEVPKDAIFIGIGLCYQYREVSNLDSTEFYFLKALQYQENWNKKDNLALTYQNLGSLYFEKYDDKKAKLYWLKGLQLNGGVTVNIESDLNYNLADLYESEGNSTKALHHYKQYVKYQDSIWNRDKLWELAEQKRKFEGELKEQRIQSLKKDKALQQAEIEKKQNQRNALLGLTGALVLLGSAITVLYRSTKKKNEVISQQKEHLDELNATKNKLFSIVAHDLRAPVQALGRNNQKLQNKVLEKENTELADLLKQNKQGIESTYKLLDNLLHWSLSQAEELYFQSESVDLRRIIEQVEYNYKPLLREKKIEFLLELCNVALIKADINTLKIVFRNLLDNAIRFTPENGYIRIYLVKETLDELIVSFEDSGEGVEAEKKSILFAIPSEKKSVSTQKKNGAGLGMYLCKELMQKNGGDIQLNDDYEGGAGFILTFKKA